MESPRIGPACPPSRLSSSQSSLASETGTSAPDPQGGNPPRPEPRVPGESCLGSACPAVSLSPPPSLSDLWHFQFMFTELWQWGTKASQTQP